jgi:hypothetical protein
MERPLGLIKVKSSSQRIAGWEIGKASQLFSFTLGEWLQPDMQSNAVIKDNRKRLR